MARSPDDSSLATCTCAEPCSLSLCGGEVDRAERRFVCISRLAASVVAAPPNTAALWRRDKFGLVMPYLARPRRPLKPSATPAITQHYGY